MASLLRSRSLRSGIDHTCCMLTSSSLDRRQIRPRMYCIVKLSCNHSIQNYWVCRAQWKNPREDRHQVCNDIPLRRQRQSGRSFSINGTKSQVDDTSDYDDQGSREQTFQEQEKLGTSVWDCKPFWCQPWTIVGTGAAVVSFVNLISQGSILWTVVVGIPITVWWFLFLVVYPAQFKEYVEGQQGFQQPDKD